MPRRNAADSPYYVAPGPSPNRRILLICYHAPPSNEVGARRWAGMARCLHDAGWGLDIIAADPSSLQRKNAAGLADLPSGTRIFGVPFILPVLDQFVDSLVRARHRLRARWHRPATTNGPVVEHAILKPVVEQSRARRWLESFHEWRKFVGEGGWARDAAVVGRRIFEPNLHQWVVSCGPPHMAHEGGRILASWTGLPLIADFRDPWRFYSSETLSPTFTHLATKYESRAVAASTLTLTNTDGLRALMGRAYPDNRVLTITNGVDEDPIPPSRPEKKFIIGHPGTIYLGRDPEPLFRAVGGLVKQLELDPEDIGLEFMGFHNAQVIARLQSLAATYDVEAFLSVRAGLPRPQALEFMARCAMFAVLQQGSALAIPAKLFECVRFPAWMLVLCGLSDATALLLEGTGADVLDPSDAPGIEAALTKRYLEFRTSGRPSPLADQARFTRRFQTDVLLEAMQSALSPARVRSMT